MEARIETLLKYGDILFTKKQPLNSLHQEIADNFYPERSDFTTQRSLGADFAANMVTSYPILARRDLGNAFSAMLRPNDRDWFAMHTGQEDQESNEDKRWLEWASGTMRRAMYDRLSGFVRATKEGDHDFAAFGQCVLSAELSHNRDKLLYRCWHLRDVAWCEGADGMVNEVHRKWEPFVQILNSVFRGNLSPEAKKILEKDPYALIKVRHVVLPADQYDSPKKWRTPFVSIFFEEATGFVLEETGSHDLIYIIPRWQTVSGSQYAYSPAAVAALPDARLIQSMTLVLLEAGEKAVNPPMIGRAEAIRSDMNLFAGGFTSFDLEFDERLGEVLRPLNIDSRGIPMGMEMRKDVQEMIKQAFFLNKLSGAPQGGPEMTAYQVGQMVQQYIRDALPLFEPMEMDYNGAICEHTFNLMARANAFHFHETMPKSLSKANIQFRFESPLHQAVAKQKGQIWLEAKGILADAVALDPSCATMMDAPTALRDVLDGIGVPSKWVRDPQQKAEIDQAHAEQAQTQQLLSTLTQGGAAAEAVGRGAQALGLGGAAQQPQGRPV
jgi:hypothetical protein